MPRIHWLGLLALILTASKFALAAPDSNGLAPEAITISAGASVHRAPFERSDDPWRIGAGDREDDELRYIQTTKADEEDTETRAEAERRAAQTDEPVATPPICGRMRSSYLTCHAVTRFCGGEPGLNQTFENYAPRHKGVAFEALDLESKACPVSDASYQLLDEIVDEVLGRAAALSKPQDRGSRIRFALAVSRITGEVLWDKGFRLCDTETLGDALNTFRKPEAPPLHFVDCDTGSLILITVAENLGLSASLVEVLLPIGGRGHNFVRWDIYPDTRIDWDVNARLQCSAPGDSSSFRGKSMTALQAKSYLLLLRAASLWRRSDVLRSRQEIRELELTDLRKAISLFPQHPSAYSNFAWIVATGDFHGRMTYRDGALQYAEKLVTIERRPVTLDTVACTYALAGDFAKAVAYEKEAIAMDSDADPQKYTYQRRLEYFTLTPPRDCTGWE